MDDEPIDLSGLDPEWDKTNFERTVRKITVAAAPLLARRRLRGSIWWQLAQWRQPIFAVGLAAVLLLLGVMQFEAPTQTVAAGGDEVAMALGVPEAWATADSNLTAARILYEGGDQ